MSTDTVPVIDTKTHLSRFELLKVLEQREDLSDKTKHLTDSDLELLGFLSNNIPVSEICKRKEFPYSKFYASIEKLISLGVITEEQYIQYKNESKFSSKVKAKDEILNQLRNGVPPMRISENLGLSRQRIYQIIDWFVDNKIITFKERKSFLSRTKARKQSYLTINKNQTKEKLLKVILKNPSITIYDLCEIFKIKKNILSKYFHELVSEGKLDFNSCKAFTGPIRLKQIEKKQKIMSTIVEDIKHMTFIELAKHHKICVKSAHDYMMEAIEQGLITKEEYQKLNEEKR